MCQAVFLYESYITFSFYSKSVFTESLFPLMNYFLLHLSDLEEYLQDEALNIPGPVDQLLADYAKRFHKIKTPRKLLWKKNLGTVKVRHFKIYNYLRFPF